MPGGRPTKLTPELQEEILDLVREGNYAKTACLAVGITERTLQHWKARAEEHTNGHEPPENEKVYVQFFRLLKDAEAKAESDLLKKVRTAKPGWQAWMTIMERRWPNRWGRSEKRIHEHTIPQLPEITQRLRPKAEEKAHELLRELGADNASGAGVQSK